MPTLQLHADKFEQMVARRGRDVKWNQAILCSCWNMSSQQPNYACLACGGKGYTYEDPIMERVLIQSVTASKDFEEMAGVFEVGDAVMTVPKRVFTTFTDPRNTSGVGTLRYQRENRMFDVGMYDLVTLMDDDYKTAELLVKGEDIFRRPADTLLNTDVVEIITIRISNPSTGVITKYTPSTDFTSVGSRIQWVGNRPSEGQQYSVVYTHRPVFTVLLNLPKPRHQDDQDLPRYSALRYRAGGFEPK